MGLRTVRILLWLPLVAFLAILGLVSAGLIRPHDDTIRSQMIGRAVPPFSLPRDTGGAPVTLATLADGHPKLVNLFASWCLPCIAETPQLLAMQRAGVTIVGIAVRDKPGDLAQFLMRYGNPYALVARDDTSAFQVSLGSSGVPESFVIDGKGVIRAQHIGEITADQVAEMIAAVGDAR